MTVFARVVFPLPLDQSFLYAVPEEYRPAARPGSRVVAPLGTRRQNGFIVALTTEFPLNGAKNLRIDLCQIALGRVNVNGKLFRFTGDCPLFSVIDAIAAVRMISFRSGASLSHTALLIRISPMSVDWCRPCR